ncbi:LamG-like jellyroll fold domain-containing protein [Paenibacillus sp. 1P07SE]|uniref:LamG domain-containing protein n=1 Tax=Paenibacillus sp. 1P07SE TaxID=3132209 RepID=UPI0039A5B0A3
MNDNTMRNRYQRSLIRILCLAVALTFTGIQGFEPAHAAVSPLITSYKPQAVSADANLSYTDANGNTITATIHHPGIAMSLPDLDNMRDHVRAGDEPWNTAFQAFANDRRSSKTPRIFYEQGKDLYINIRGPWAATIDGIYYANPSEHVGNRANWDSETAFHQAVMWYITGDETYRSNAMYIIRGYAGIQSVVPHTNFRFGTMTYLLGAAAEILRYSDTPTTSLKWTTADTQNLSQMMGLVWNAYEERHPNFFMNQHQFAVMGIMARAIFTNDLELYAEAVEATTVNAQGENGGRNGSIKHQMRWMTQNDLTGAPLNPSDYHVQLMEMGRDAGHAYANIAGLSTLAQTIYAQGTKVDPVNGTMSTAANAVNVFNFLDDRLLAGTTYALKYNLGYDVPWTPAVANQSYTGQIFDKNNSAGERGRIDAFYSVLYNYYKYIEGQDMTQEKFKYLAYAYETRMPEVAGKDYPLAMLLYTPDAAKTVGLSNRITLGNLTGLTATAAGPDAIHVSWTAVSGTLGYNVFRSTEENGTYVQINSVPVTTTSYNDTGLDPNTRYYYKVRVSGGAMSAAVSADTTADSRLQAWYKLDETSGTSAADASGYGNIGTVHGGAVWTTGRVGHAVDLNGTNGYIALPAGLVSGSHTSTIAAWVNLDSVSSWTRVFDFGSGTSTNMFLTPRNGANGKVRFAIKNNGSSEQIIDGQSALPAGGWHHVAVTLNGAVGKLYVDGLEVGSNASITIKPSDLGATTQNWIGRSQYASDPYLDGRVDDFRVYNQALTASEIAALAGL